MKNPINITAPINELGYGIFSVETVIELEKSGYNPCLFPVNNQIDVPQDKYKKLIPSLSRQQQFYYNGNSLRIWHQFDMSSQVGKGVKAGYTFFEVDKLNMQERHHLNSLDCLFVSSEWYKKVCIENDINKDKIQIARPGVNSEIFNDTIPPLLNYANSTVFLNIGKWEVRKGHDILVEAFNKAFTEKDDVILIMCCFNPLVFKDFNGPKESKKWEQYYKSSKLGLINKILVVEERLKTQQELAGLINSCDYGVFPSRAEGWNLDAAEMLACGKQVIMTDFSAHTEFMSYSNSKDLAIEIDSTEEAFDGVFFDYTSQKEKPEWAHFGKSQVEQLINSLRKCHEQKQSGLVKKVTGFSEKFSWSNTVKEIDRGISLYE